MIDAKIDAAINQGKKKRPKKKAGEEVRILIPIESCLFVDWRQ